MILADLAGETTVSWIVWMAIGLVMELVFVALEKKKGTQPLTRVVRDRAMRKSTPVKLGGLLFFTWLWLHFNLGPGSGW